MRTFHIQNLSCILKLYAPNQTAQIKTVHRKSDCPNQIKGRAYFQNKKQLTTFTPISPGCECCSKADLLYFVKMLYVRMFEQLIILIRIAAVPSNLFVTVGSALTPEWSIRCVCLLK